MPEDGTDWIRRIHRGPLRLVIVAAGGGGDAVTRLLAEPGASRTVLEAVVPYAESAHRGFAPGVRGSAVSRERARALADRAYDRAVRLCGGEGPVAGVACTAALATDRIRRGEEQAFICLRFRDRRVHGHLQFAKGGLPRPAQEQEVSRAVLAALMPIELPGLHWEMEPAGIPLPAGADHWLLVHRDGQWQPDGKPAPNLYPGSFNPLHRGHVRLARVVAGIRGTPVDLELSVDNADKPPVQPCDLARRLAGIQGRLRVVLTRAPTFIEKARRFPGRTFVVGFDTAVRLVEPGYYGGDLARRDAALEEMRQLGCRFLVAGRIDGELFKSLPDLSLPPGSADLFEPIPAALFREDISATELRRSAFHSDPTRQHQKQAPQPGHL